MTTQPALAFQNTLPALPLDERNTHALPDRLKHKYSDRITGSIFLPSQERRYAELPKDLPEALANALKTRGIHQLYSHQAETWRAVEAGEHMVVAAPTAPGLP